MEHNDTDEQRMKIDHHEAARVSVLKLFVGAPVGPKTGVRLNGENPVLGPEKDFSTSYFVLIYDMSCS